MREEIKRLREGIKRLREGIKRLREGIKRLREEIKRLREETSGGQEFDGRSGFFLDPAIGDGGEFAERSDDLGIIRDHVTRDGKEFVFGASSEDIVEVSE